MENNSLKVKDLINIGIFSALYMAISLLTMSVAMFSPLLWMLWPAIAGALTGTLYMLLMAKVQKKGAALLMGLICGLLYFAMGECTWVIVITFLIAGITAEAVRSSFGYQNYKGNIISCGVLCVGFIGSPLPMWLFQESYMDSIIKMGMDPAYVAKMSNMVSIWSLLGMIIVAVIGGIIGAIIGKSLLKKHFAKAGII
jgi:energy-coupling factor transport system substrate-specific component